MENKWKFHEIEVKNPTLDACIIHLDNNNIEISREYFGRNARIVINENYEK